MRARLNQPNHFYVGNYHIETVPLSWTKKTGHYEVEVRMAERYGNYGQLEEHLGHIILKGKLIEQERDIDALVGVAKHRFRDSFGNPRLDVVAGYQPQESLSPLSAATPPSTTATR